MGIPLLVPDLMRRHIKQNPTGGLSPPRDSHRFRPPWSAAGNQRRARMPSPLILSRVEGPAHPEALEGLPRLVRPACDSLPPVLNREHI